MGRRMGYCQLASSGPEIWFLEQACAMTLSGRSLQNLIWHLTPEFSRTAARNGRVVHATMQPSREAVSA